MSDDRLSWPDRTGGNVAKSDDEIEFDIAKLIPGFTASIADVDVVVTAKDLQGKGVRMRLGAGSCTNRIESVAGKSLYEIFGDNATSGVVGAEEEKFKALFIHGAVGLGWRDCPRRRPAAYASKTSLI